jgi:hypothetical protein
MKIYAELRFRIGMSVLSAVAVLALVATAHQPPVFALASSADPKATIKSYNFGWKHQEHFYFRVQFGNKGDLDTFTKTPWHFEVTYVDDDSAKSTVWKDSYVTYANPNAFWATIRVTAKSTNRDVKPSPQQRSQRPRGTGKSTVVITNDDRPPLGSYKVPPKLNDLEEDQNP